MYLVGEDRDDDEDIKAKDIRNQMDSAKDQQQELIEKRLLVLDSKIKGKFSNLYDSVRKAFLSLDCDYDGYITVEEILKVIGQTTELNYNDLKKLIIDKDRNKIGQIDYPDFSKWLGNSIQMSEGFYFRHDSIKNPNYEMQVEKGVKNHKEDDKIEAAKALLTGDIQAKILDKIKIQWKTIRKAFNDLNMEKTGAISKREFKYFLDFWGIEIDQKTFDGVFATFDLDGDGKISYKDFQMSIGSELFPAEGLYFRQDKEQIVRITTCSQPNCF